MGNSVLTQIFASRIEGLKRESKSLNDLKHSGIKGAAREILVRQILAPLMPPYIKALTGSIINASNDDRIEQNEDDIVLFDQRKAPLIWAEAGCALIPIEGIIACIEVKSTLKFEDIIKSIKAMGELVRIAPQDPPPFGALFAYNNNLSESSNNDDFSRLLTALKYWTPTYREQTSPIRCLCVAGRGCWILPECQHGRREGWHYVSPEDGHDVLTFLGIISNSLYSHSHPGAIGASSYIGNSHWHQLVRPWPVYHHPDPRICGRCGATSPGDS